MKFCNFFNCPFSDSFFEREREGEGGRRAGKIGMSRESEVIAGENTNVERERKRAENFCEID